RYGSVFTLYMGPKKVVVLTGYQTVKEAFVSYADEFGERDTFKMAEEAGLHHGRKGLLFKMSKPAHIQMLIYWAQSLFKFEPGSVNQAQCGRPSAMNDLREQSRDTKRTKKH
ncbi:hypothetical protein ATANTOWER_007016, partial [Ataeniobius toweri]|nr:hypothetical protein [Ataeniobius toweri]